MTLSLDIRQADRELVHMAEQLIKKHHPELRLARILWLMSNAKKTREGRIRLGVGKKLSPEARFLSSGLCSVDDGYDFMITLSDSAWRSLDAKQRLALLDHQLTHCMRKERVNRRSGATSYAWARRGHDLEEFVEIVERHGLWSRDVKRLVTVGAQLALPIAFPLEPAMGSGEQPAVRKTTTDGTGLVLTTEIVEQDAGIVRTRDQVLADLDERGERLNGQAADAEVEDLKKDLDAILDDRQPAAASEPDPRMPADWRQRVGLDQFRRGGWTL